MRHKNILLYKVKNKPHDGIDLSAKTGTPVYAMYEGIATLGYVDNLGYYVIIKSTKEEHKLDFEQNTIWISYAHLQSYVNEINGKYVKQGDLIGYTGNSGKIAANIDDWQYHLHVTVYNGPTSNKYNRVNPAKYLTTKFDDEGKKND